MRELPDSVGFAEGATLGIPAMTAHVALFAAGPVQGRTVLVTGGAGAVGHYAVQLAKWAGASVRIATVSSAGKGARRRRAPAGPNLVVNYRTEDVRRRRARHTGGEGVDHVVDVDFGGNLATTIKCVKPNGSIAFYASKGEPAPRVVAGELMRKNISVHGMVAAADISARGSGRGGRRTMSTRWIVDRRRGCWRGGRAVSHLEDIAGSPRGGGARGQGGDGGGGGLGARPLLPLIPRPND